MAFCSNCGAKLSGDEKFCSECGVRVKNNATIKQQDNSTNSTKDEIVEEFNLYGEVIYIDTNWMKYHDMRKFFKALNGEIKNNTDESWQYLNSLDKFVQKAPELVRNIVYLYANTSVNILYEYGVDYLTVDGFLDKYYWKYINYDQYFDPIVEAYAEITNAYQELKSYREMQNASKSRWQGGGFGLSGAIKGAVTAGILNMGTDFFRSFGENKIRNEDERQIQQAKSGIFNKYCTKEQFIQTLHKCAWGCFDALIDELCEHQIMKPIGFDDAKAYALYENTVNYEKNSKKILDNIIHCIKLSPYNYRYWEAILKGEGNTEEVMRFAAFLGVIEEHNALLRDENAEKISTIGEMSEKFPSEIYAKIQAYLKLEIDSRIDLTNEIVKVLSSLTEWAFDESSTADRLSEMRDKFSDYLHRNIFIDYINMLDKKYEKYKNKVSIVETEKDYKRLLSNPNKIFELVYLARRNYPIIQYKLYQLFFPKVVFSDYKPKNEFSPPAASDEEKETIHDVVMEIFDKNLEFEDDHGDDWDFQTCGFDLYMDVMNSYMYYGELLESDIEKLEKAADMDCPAALYQLGQLYFNGDSCLRQNISNAIKYTTLAADALYPPACYELSSWYKNGKKGIEKNEFLSQKYGELLGETIGGMVYIVDKTITTERYEECKRFIENIKEFIETIDTTYMDLSEHYEKTRELLITFELQYSSQFADNIWNKLMNKYRDIGSEQLLELAKKQFDAAIYFVYTNKDEDSEYEMLHPYYSDVVSFVDSNGVGELYTYVAIVRGRKLCLNGASAAVTCFINAAKNGSIEGLMGLAKCYKDGLGVQTDHELAFELYMKCAEEYGDAQSQNEVGHCYQFGVGVKEDKKEAVAWYQKSADNNCVDAQCSLALCYKNAIGIDRDCNKAVYWYTKAAEKGHSYAQNNLGVCYQKGEGVEKSRHSQKN